MTDFEKLGEFYLGRPYDLAAREPRPGYLLYDSKDLVTHAVCFGMTGSGKTGLCVGLLEEAAIDGIPAIVIDPKGDLGNLLLTFPELRPNDFEPWIQPAEAMRKGVTPGELAASKAAQWRKGLESWGQGPERIARLRESAEMTIYTPGSEAGVPLSVLRSFDAPSEQVREDRELMRDHVDATAAGLLGMMGVKSDNPQSRERILISLILDHAWREGRGLDLKTLIHQIQSPPVERVGVFDLDTFYPASERFQLAMALNNLLAAPGFESWMRGDPLDVGRLLYAGDGKPRISILSIAHLNDAERMFFVSLLLNQVLSWMRRQPGTSGLRAILYMDEIFGFFPPTANPPSKQPLLTLLKQARAFGLGVVLATQNPMDLDYKGLSNTGTWFVGRLQTDRDQARVLDGLAGAAAGSGQSFDRGAMQQTIAGLGQRIFLMYNVHEGAPRIFETRWVLSYLAGPLTREQIKRLTASSREGTAASPQAAVAGPVAASRPVLPPEIPQSFVPVRSLAPQGAGLSYQPALLGDLEIRFQSSRHKIDEQRRFMVWSPLDDDVAGVDWERGGRLDIDRRDLEVEPEAEASFGNLPSESTNAKSYRGWERDLITWAYSTERARLFTDKQLKLTSKPEETEQDFRLRLSLADRERRDLEKEKLQQKFQPKFDRLQEKIRRAEQAVDKEKAEAGREKVSSILSVGASLLGAFMGRRTSISTKVSRAGTAVRALGRSGKQADDVGRAEENLAAAAEDLKQLEQQFAEELDAIAGSLDAASGELEEIAVRPKKSDIRVPLFTLAWMPYWRDEAGREEPAWE